MSINWIQKQYQLSDALKRKRALHQALTDAIQKSKL